MMLPDPESVHGDTMLHKNGERLCEQLYTNRQWFALRDVISKTTGDPFYRGVVASVFDQTQECQDCLQPIIQSAPNSSEAREAHRLLTWMHLRKSEFPLALEHMQAMARCGEESDSLLAARKLFSCFARHPGQVVERSEASKLVYKVIDGHLFVSALMNGIQADCMMDSGAGLSFITESEARRLGIEAQDAGPQGLQMYGALGSQTSYRVAIARQLEIGNLLILNVPFLVLTDDQFQFPAGCQTALGLPVLLALRTLCWRADGTLLIGAQGRKKNLAISNLCFDSGDLVTEATVLGRNITLLLDIGCGETVLWPPFAKQFAHMIQQSGAVGSTRLHGISGAAEVKSVTLPQLQIEVADFTMLLCPAPVLTRPTTPNSRWLSGCLGVDLLSQAASVLLDFDAMRLSFAL